MMAVRALGIFVLGLSAAAARAESGVRHIYIQAAAAAEKCAGLSLNVAQVARLAAAIDDAGHGPAPVTDVSAELDAARAASPPDCRDLYTQIHLQFFQRSILPKIQLDAGASTSAASAATGV